MFVSNYLFQVRRSGYAFRAGIRKGDTIYRINNTYTDDLTLQEAQRIIRKSGKELRIFVTGYDEHQPNRYAYFYNNEVFFFYHSRNDDIEENDEFTVDFWFKRKQILQIISFLFVKSIFCEIFFLHIHFKTAYFIYSKKEISTNSHCKFMIQNIRNRYKKNIHTNNNKTNFRLINGQTLSIGMIVKSLFTSN